MMEFDRRGSDASFMSMNQPPTPSFGGCSREFLTPAKKPVKKPESIISVILPCSKCSEKFVIEKPILTGAATHNVIIFDHLTLRCKTCGTGKNFPKGEHPPGSPKGREKTLEEKGKRQAIYLGKQTWVCCGDEIRTNVYCGTRNSYSLRLCAKCQHGCEEYCINYPFTTALYPKPVTPPPSPPPPPPPPPPIIIQWLAIPMEGVENEEQDTGEEEAGAANGDAAHE